MNSVKSTVDVVKTHRLLLLKLLLAIQVGFLGYLLFSSIRDGHYFLAHEDEAINYCSAKVFSETGSVRAEGCIAEEVSRIGQMNWYGPGYAVFYGSLLSIFGDIPTLFIKLHAASALLSLMLIFALPISGEQKLLMATITTFTQTFTAYIFTYFPESFHFLVAIVLIFFLLKVHQETEKRRQRPWEICFVLLVLVAILFRVTYVFWLAALILVSESRSKAWKRAVLFLAVLAVTLLYMKLFTAPPYAGEMQKIDQLYEFNLWQFLWKTIKALLRNTFFLVTSGASGVYFLIGLLITSAFCWWKTRDRFLLASTGVSLVLLAALMAYYSPGPWYFLKQSAILVPLLVVGLVRAEISGKLKYGVLMVTVGWFLASEKNLTVSIAEHRAASDKFQASDDFRLALNQLKDFISGSKPITVLWCYDEYDFGGTTEALLPFSTRDGAPILYTSNVLSADSASEVKFTLHGKLKIDYLLSRQPVSFEYAKEIHQTTYYHLYKVENE